MRELIHITIFGRVCQAFSATFLKKFFEVRLPARPFIGVRCVSRDSLSIISYLISFVKRFEELFFKFFSNRSTCEPGIEVGAACLTRQPDYYIISGLFCQAIFKTFSSFFGSPDRWTGVWMSAPRVSRDSLPIILYFQEKVNCFFQVFSIFFGLFCAYFAHFAAATRCCVFAERRPQDSAQRGGPKNRLRARARYGIIRKNLPNRRERRSHV